MIPLTMAESSARALPSDYPYARGARVAPALTVDPDTKVSRAQLTTLCDSIMGALADRQGPAALESAGRILLSWVGGRGDLAGSDWSMAMRRLARRLLSLARQGDAARVEMGDVFGIEGNEKLPFVTFGTLPVYTCPGAGECARWCYSLKSWRYPTAFARQLLTTILLRVAPHVIKRAFAQVPNGITLRLYVDGDFGSMEDVALWMGLLKGRPDVKAYGYSKSWDLLAHWGRENRGAWPANYLLNLSSGGRALTSREEMLALPITRGEFLGVSIKGRYKGSKGFERYETDAYKRAVREAARALGLTGRIMLCPGKCGECLPKGHACGMDDKRGLVIVNGIH